MKNQPIFVPVASGVSQALVLHVYPSLFLYYINDITVSLISILRLIVDDTRTSWSRTKTALVNAIPRNNYRFSTLTFIS
jgi:hypothetical protein